MNRPETFEKSLSVLVQAHNEGTLQHMSCQACAVGNLVAAGMGYTYKIEDIGSVRPYIGWVDEKGERTRNISWFQNLNFDGTSPTGDIQLASTGYTKEELSLIEDVFEANFHKDGWTSSEKGLEAVYLELCKMHELPDIERVDFDVLFVPKECGEEVGVEV